MKAMTSPKTPITHRPVLPTNRGANELVTVEPPEVSVGPELAWLHVKECILDLSRQMNRENMFQ